MSLIKNERVKAFLNSLSINDIVVVKENDKTATVLNIDYNTKEITIKWDIHKEAVKYSAYDVYDLWEIRKTSHFHNWKIYHGIFESYYFCSICDTKKPIEKTS